MVYRVERYSHSKRNNKRQTKNEQPTTSNPPMEADEVLRFAVTGVDRIHVDLRIVLLSSR